MSSKALTSDTDHNNPEGKYFVLWQLLSNNAFQILCHFKWVEELAFARALTWVLPQLQCTVAAHSLPLYSPPTILPERLARCLDSWAEPQQVYRLQFRGLAATRAGDGRVMRPCTTQRGAPHKSRPTQGACGLTKGPGLGRQSLSYQTESIATATIKAWTVAWFKGKGGLSCNKAPHQIASIRTHQRSCCCWVCHHRWW